MSKSISEIQDEIIREFSLLDGDMEMTVFYIMELGQKLPEMREADKTEDNIVKGCQSKVWLTARHEGWQNFLYSRQQYRYHKRISKFISTGVQWAITRYHFEFNSVFHAKDRHGTVHRHPTF
jgi:hypothetical protein